MHRLNKAGGPGHWKVAEALADEVPTPLEHDLGGLREIISRR